jgi:hypothetical protein
VEFVLNNSVSSVRKSLAFGKSWVQISAHIPVVLTDILCDIFLVLTDECGDSRSELA